MFTTLKRLKRSNKKLPRRLATSAFPFRPGYALGDILPNGVIKSMKAEGVIRSKLTVLEQLEIDFTNTKREILLRRNQITNKQRRGDTGEGSQTISQPGQYKLYNDLDNFIRKITDEQDKGYRELFQQQMEMMSNPVSAEENSNFQSRVESPIDWTKSDVAIMKRGFDSITIHSDYMSTQDVKQQMAAFKGKVSNSMDVSVAGLSASVARTVEENLTATHENNDVEGTIVLTCRVSTRNVRVFKPLVYDADKLISAWRNIHGSYPNIMTPDIKKKITLMTETVMGGALVGCVHLVRSEMTTQSQSNTAVLTDSSVKVAGLLARLAGMSFNYSLSTEFGAKIASVISSSGLQTQFDLYCLGTIPTIEKDTIKQAIRSFGGSGDGAEDGFDPAKFNIMKSGDGGGSTSSSGDSNSSTNADVVTRQSNAANNITATVAAIYKNESTQDALTFTSFLNAFTDFVNKMRDDEYSGIPIGMNFTELDEQQVINIANDLLKAKGAEAAAAGGTTQ